MRCTCDVGPGRFEGESPLTAVMHERSMRGGGGDSLSWGDGRWAELAVLTDEDRRGGFDEEDRKAAREAGFCDACIEEDEERYREAKAVTFGSGSEGFLWSVTWDDADEAQAAYDEDAAELEEQEDEG